MSDGRTGVTSARTSRVTRDETKPSFLTTEFYAFVAAVAAVLIAAAQADNFDAPRAWTLVAALAVGYMLSRGLAKSGSAHRDRD
jgi:di/tricarboxylate transporter